MLGLSWIEIGWRGLKAAAVVLTIAWALLALAVRVGPDEAIHKLSEWARKFGIKDPPEAWLKTLATSRRLRRGASAVVAALIFIVGVFIGNWLQPSATSPPLPSSPSGQASQPGPSPRLRTDLTRLLGELPVLSDLIERGLPLSTDLANLLKRQPRQVTLTLSVADAKSEIHSLQDKFISQRAEFYAFLTGHAYDRSELEKLVSWTNIQASNPRRPGEEYGVIVVDLGNYRNELDRLPPNPSAADLLRNGNLWGLYVSLLEDQKRLYYWITDTRQRINNKRSELALLWQIC